MNNNKNDTTCSNSNQRTQILKEEEKIEKQIINAITTGKPESLKPNTGEAIQIGDSYVCVSYSEEEEEESDCRVWEWHGHVVFYSEERGGYAQEYVYGNYFERIDGGDVRRRRRRECACVFGGDFCWSDGEDEEERVFGLRELVGGLGLIDPNLFRWNLNGTTTTTSSSEQLFGKFSEDTSSIKEHS